MADTNFDSLRTSGAITSSGAMSAASVSGTTVAAPADGVRAGGDPVVARLPATYRCNPNGDLADEVFFVADRAYTVVSMRQIHATAATATGVTLQVTKDTGTQAPGAGTDLLATPFDLTAAASTVQTASLTTAAGALDLAAGNRLSVDFSATGAPLAGVAVTVMLKPKV